MQLFYAPEISGTSYFLSEAESKHCIRVLRLKEGSPIVLVNGRGALHKAEIVDANPKKCQVFTKEIIDPFEPLSYDLHIAIAPTKNIDRTEWFLEKVTEIGISTITPILSEHSERKVIKKERLEKVIVAAMKQSLKAFKPSLGDLMNFEDFVKSCNARNKYIAHCNEPSGRKVLSKENVGESTCILIGPEGDFSETEVELAKQHGFTEISLGKSRLRTETAGVVACHTVALRNE